MAAPSYSRSLVSSFKRLRLSPSSPIIQTQVRSLAHSPRDPAQSTPSDARPANTGPESSPASSSTTSPTSPPRKATIQELNALRLPKAVQATYLQPLRRAITHNQPACDLQLRSYSARNLEVFADFALRAAYFLRLPAKGPVPLRRITERWTVPRSNFVHKKSQENFERATLRRWIRVVDAHPDAVALWLAFLRKHAYYGVGMKASVYEHGGLEVAADLDAEQAAIGQRLGEKLELVGGRPAVAGDAKELEKLLLDEPFKGAWGANAALGGAPSAPHANERIESVRLNPSR